MRHLLLALAFVPALLAQPCQDYACDSAVVQLILDTNRVPAQISVAYASIRSADRIVGLQLHNYSTSAQILPASIGRLSALRRLTIWWGSTVHLPEELGQLSELCTLDVNGTLLGQLPPAIGSLSHLQVLRASGCNLRALPAEIGMLTALETLSIRGNRLWNMPQSTGRLQSLRFLDLSYNQLSDLLDSIVRLPAHASVDLTGNNLCPVAPDVGRWLDSTQGIAWRQTQDCWEGEKVLVANTLPDVLENQFDAADGAISWFWLNDWRRHEIVRLDVPNNCYPGACPFTGMDDAEMTIQAAAGVRGLYLYVVALDNIWVDRESITDWGADVIELYLDSKSSREIEECLPGCEAQAYPGYSTSLTKSSQQLHFWLGATQPPTGLRYSCYDSSQSEAWQIRELTWSDARQDLGLEVEFVAIDSSHKALEMCIPWRSVGQGIADGASLAGRRIAFSGGYDDKDGEYGNPDLLRWMLYDPWSDISKLPWGDIQFADDAPPVGVKSGTLVSRQAPRHALRTEYFDLAGRRCAQRPRAAGVTVQRTMLSNGTVVLGHRALNVTAMRR